MPRSTTFRSYNAVRGWVDKPDAIALLAQAFAEKLGEVTCVRSPRDPDQDDARQVNNALRMLNEMTGQLATLLVADAERSGLEPNGGWLPFGTREFEVPGSDARLSRADFENEMRVQAAE